MHDFSGDEINSIDLSENHKFLVTGDDEGRVNIIDLTTDKIYKKMTKQHSAICMSVRFRPKKSWDVWSGGMDSKIYEWDFSRGSVNSIYDMTPKEPSASQMFNPPFVYTTAISEDGKWIAAGLGDSTIQLISPRSKKSPAQEIRLQNGHNMSVNCLSFIQPTQLLSGSANGKLAIWGGFEEKTGSTLDPIHQLKLEGPIDKLDCLETYLVQGQTWIAASGASSQLEQGALCLYTI
ncbi:WD40-repeat-containing domain protein [Sporodiniella umbellata]|nr:WD40-repeat-containing domain protein [Sporodiniella umbellata]